MEIIEEIGKMEIIEKMIIFTGEIIFFTLSQILIMIVVSNTYLRT